jgi:hypothetical protein
MLVRAISRIGDKPSTVITRSSCSEAKSIRPPASSIHNYTP